MRDLIIFDLDGTLRDTTGGEHCIPSDPTKAVNWQDWQQWVNENGKPIKENVDYYHKCL